MVPPAGNLFSFAAALTLAAGCQDDLLRTALCKNDLFRTAVMSTTEFQFHPRASSICLVSDARPRSALAP